MTFSFVHAADFLLLRYESRDYKTRRYIYDYDKIYCNVIYDSCLKLYRTLIMCYITNWKFKEYFKCLSTGLQFHIYTISIRWNVLLLCKENNGNNISQLVHSKCAKQNISFEIAARTFLPNNWFCKNILNL